LTRVILADSNELIRIGLRTILSGYADVEIAGEAVDSDELRKQIAIFAPDIVMIDYASVGFSIDIIPEILQKIPSIRFVAITLEQSAATIINALKGGVMSHVKKDCDLQEIIDSVKSTAAGNQFFCGKILETIAKDNIDLDDIELEMYSCEPVSITDREQEIIRMIAEGYTNAQIADKLCLSNHTVNTHRKNIMQKLGAKNTAGIVMYAVKANLVSPNKYLFATPVY